MARRSRLEGGSSLERLTDRVSIGPRATRAKDGPSVIPSLEGQAPSVWKVRRERSFTRLNVEAVEGTGGRRPGTVAGIESNVSSAVLETRVEVGVSASHLSGVSPPI